MLHYRSSVLFVEPRALGGHIEEDALGYTMLRWIQGLRRFDRSMEAVTATNTIDQATIRATNLSGREKKNTKHQTNDLDRMRTVRHPPNITAAAIIATIGSAATATATSTATATIRET